MKFHIALLKWYRRSFGEEHGEIFSLQQDLAPFSFCRNRAVSVLILGLILFLFYVNEMDLASWPERKRETFIERRS